MKPPHGDILVKHDEEGYSWPCWRCGSQFVPKFYNPLNKRGFGRWQRCCKSCQGINILSIVFGEDQSAP